MNVAKALCKFLTTASTGTMEITDFLFRLVIKSCGTCHLISEPSGTLYKSLAIVGVSKHLTFVVQMTGSGTWENNIYKYLYTSKMAAISPLKPEFAIIFFIHCKPLIHVAYYRLVVDEDDLKWVTSEKRYLFITKVPWKFLFWTLPPPRCGKLII